MPRVDINMGGPKWTQMQQELIVARAAQEEADVAALKAMQEAARRERKAGRRSNTSKNKALLKGVIEGLVTVPSAFSHPAGAARFFPKMSSATSTPPGSNSTSPSSVGVPTMWGVEPSQPGHSAAAASAASAASTQAGWTPSLHQHVLHLNVNRGA